MLRPLSNEVFHTSPSRFARTLSSLKCLSQRCFSCSAHLRSSDPTTSSNILRDIQRYTTDHPISIFTSTTNNPYHNLAIENYILKHSEPNSSILFTYVNRPCIVFGRNQNPWLEIDIARAQEGLPWKTADWQDYGTDILSVRSKIKPVREREVVALDLVRRRSGGGTVIHDAGNLNFSFIVPNDKDFTRNKHARLIVSALQAYLEQPGSQPAYYGRDDIYVNERHDIAMKLDGQALKVSGSAFKLTKGRALHHGTLLLASPNILPKSVTRYKSGQTVFSKLLASPAKPFLDAKGVGSVSSPVHNLFDLDKRSGEEDASARRRFLLRDIKTVIMNTFRSAHSTGEIFETVVVSDNVVFGKSSINAVREDVEEMMTDAWRYGQTPTFSYNFTEGGTTINFQAKQSKISEAKLETERASEDEARVFAGINGKLLHEIDSWKRFIPSRLAGRAGILENLERTFPKVHSMSTDSPDTTIRANIVQEERIDSGGRDESSDNTHIIRRAPGQTESEIEDGYSNTIVHK